MFAWLIALMAAIQLIVLPLAAPAASGTTTPTAVPSSAVATRSAATPSASPTHTKTPQIAVLTVTRTASRIDAALTGDDFSRAWRIDLSRAGASGGRHLALSVETSDVAYLGGITISGGSGKTVTYGITAKFSYCDRDLGLCVASSGIAAPAANSRLAVTVTATAGGSYTVHAAVREVHEAPFQFGPWIEVAPHTV